tara:strand:- start:48 stop:1109 length:1062 start_codon:yes stop_codon:yes gene_type:complete
LPRLPPAAIILANETKDKTWKFTGNSNSKKTSLRRSQTVRYRSQPAGVVFDIGYNAKGSGDIRLKRLYYGTKKPEGGVPGAAVVSSLKRMIPNNYALSLTNASYVPAPTHERRLARALLPDKYDIYSGLKPTLSQKWPELRGIKKITGAILTNTPLNEAEVRKLLPENYSMYAGQLAAATGKKYNMSQLYNLLNDTGLVKRARVEFIVNRKFKKQWAGNNAESSNSNNNPEKKHVNIHMFAFPNNNENLYVWERPVPQPVNYVTFHSKRNANAVIRKLSNQNFQTSNNGKTLRFHKANTTVKNRIIDALNRTGRYNKNDDDSLVWIENGNRSIPLHRDTLRFHRKGVAQKLYY